MRRIAWSLILAAGLVSCISPPYSLGKIYVEDRLVWDADLVGEWRNPDGGVAAFRFAREGYFRYTVRLMGEEDSLDLVGYVTTIAGERWVDLAPPKPDPENGLLLALHLFVPYFVRGDTLWYRYCDDEDWERQMGPGHAVDNPDGPDFIVGTTDELQAAAAALVADTSVVWDSSYLVRVPTTIPLARVP